MTPISIRNCSALRTRKAVAAQLTHALVCALLDSRAMAFREGSSDLGGSRSLQVLRVFGYGLLAGVLLASPAVPATSLVSEASSRDTWRCS